MSALLAALKKAAEEKNKRQQRTPLASTSPPQLENEPTTETIQMDFAEGIDASESLIEPVQETMDEAAEAVQLNFVDEGLNEADPSSSETPLESDEPRQEQEADSELLQMSDEVTVDDLTPLEHASEETPHLEAEPSTEHETDAEMPPASAEPAGITDFSSLKMVKEKTDDTSGTSQRLDLETSLALNDESTSLSKTRVESKSSKQIEKPVEPEQKDKSDSEPIEEDDWSLDHIPGYQPTNEGRPSQQKMQRFIQAIQPKGGLKAHLSIKHWMWVPLVVFGLGYFGLVIYERESQRMTADLKSFQMLSAKAPVSDPQAANEMTAGKAKNEQPQPKEKNQSTILGDVAQTKDGQLTEGTKQSNQMPLKAEQPMSLTPKVKMPPQSSQTAKLSTSEIQPKADVKQGSATEPRYKIETVKPNKAVFQGYEAYASGDYAAAERFYRQAYLSDPDSLPVLFGLAATAAKKGESQKSLAMYQQILKKAPDNQQATVAAAMLEAKLMEGPDLRAKLERLVRQWPRNAQLQTAMGHQYAKKRDWVLAQKYYFKAYELDSSNPAHVRNLAISLDQLGQYALAKQYYEQTLAMSDPKQSDQRQLKNRLLVIKQHLLQESAP